MTEQGPSTVITKTQRASKRAQTASELAIFGGILIFVLGLIIRMALNFSYVQNQALAAMRLAFQQSFLTTENGAAARMFASVTFVEDRKDVDVSGSGRYGAQGRLPNVVSGMGSFTNTLFLPLEWGYDPDLFLTDMFINGQHFEFRTAAYGEINIVDCNRGVPGACPAWIAFYEDYGCGQDDTTGLDLSCAHLYTKIVNGDSKFCCNLSSPVCTPGGLSNQEDDRFNLDRNLATHCSTCANGADVPPSKRCGFSWQWYAVPATTAYMGFKEGVRNTFDIDGDLKEEQFTDLVDGCNRHFSTRYPDGKGGNVCSASRAWIARIKYVDSQNGDMDLSYDSYDKQSGIPSPGMRIESSLYAYTKTSAGEGTYLRVEEGKLYTADTKQYIRNTQKQDRADIIERQVQLSNDTGRFHFGGSDNPVESCCGAGVGCGACSCYDNANVYKTCFDTDSRILYIRSRVSDLGGKRWITDVSGDKNPFR